MNMEPIAIHWFRRDLRIKENPALHYAFQESKGRVLGLFCLDQKFLSRADLSVDRFVFFLESLRDLKEELRSVGGELLVIDSQPSQAFLTLREIFQKKGVSWRWLTYNRDYEPFARQRDDGVCKALQKTEIEIKTFRDHLVFEPMEILSPSSQDFYRVYTPYSQAWFRRLLAENHRIESAAAENSIRINLTWKSLRSKGGIEFPFEDRLDSFYFEWKKKSTLHLPPAGHKAAINRLEQFAPKLEAYQFGREAPGGGGTSRLSSYLKNGTITVGQVIRRLKLEKLSRTDFLAGTGRGKFLKELIWREFYYSILYHRPDIEAGPFLLQYQNLPWRPAMDEFDRWREGQTGFPIVDAGMRELKSTGSMHNRVRMIAASFLVKDLFLSWQWGERYFMQTLLDGDLAPNNGGWQWSASTGCDPQPYFRVFNPWLQSKRFDPNGDYIKKFIPELKDVAPKELHYAEGNRNSPQYPRPMVDHHSAALRTIMTYSKFKTRPK